MTKVSVKEFKIERRELLKWTAAAVLIGKAVDFDEVLAAGECKAVAPDKALNDITSGIINNSGISAAGNEFLFWIDGPLNAKLPNYNPANPLMQRGRLACTMVTAQTAESYIEAVILAEQSSSGLIALAHTFYGPTSDLTHSGRAPYTVFENVSFDATKTYQVIYVKNNGAGKPVSVYRHTIQGPRPSRFDMTHLIKSGADGTEGGEGHLSIAQMRDIYLPWVFDELRSFNQYKLNSGGQGSGYPTTPFSGTFSTGGGGDLHTARARILKIEPGGVAGVSGNFEIEIDFMHDDASTDNSHYMRYFLVLDPVGRVLGGVRRNVGDGVTGKVTVMRGFHTPHVAGATAAPPAAGSTARYTRNGANYYDLYGTYRYVVNGAPEIGNVPPFDNTTRAKYIDPLNILDCPYIQILTDDQFHAIARCVMRLR